MDEDDLLGGDLQEMDLRRQLLRGPRFQQEEVRHGRFGLQGQM